MAITLDSVTTKFDGGVQNTSWTHTVGSGSNRLLIVQYMTYRSVSSMDFNGVNFTPSLSNETNDTGGWTGSLFGIWGLINPDVGANTLNFRTGAIGPGIIAVSTSFFGVDQTIALQNYTATTGNAASVSDSFTTYYSNSWTIENQFNENTLQTITENNGQTQQTQFQTGVGTLATATKKFITPGNQTLGFSITNSPFGHVIMEMIESGQVGSASSLISLL